MAADLEKVTVRLTSGTRSKLQQYYPELGYNKVIRMLVDDFVHKVEERVSQSTKPSTVKVNTSILDEVIDHE